MTAAQAEQIDWVQIAEPHARARRRDPVSSHVAAKEIEQTGKAAVQRGFALAAVRAHPGRTSHELALEQRCDRHILARRLPELREDGLLRNGEMVTCTITNRKTLSWWPSA